MRHYRKTKPRTLPLGVVSEGTLRTEDLFPAFLSLANDIRLSKADRKTVRELAREYDAAENPDDLGYSPVDELQTILENYAPDYAYFGTAEGDGACFGVWPSIDSLEENARNRRYLDPMRPSSATVLKINAGDPLPALTDPYDHVMTVTDHGNVTLYRRAGRRWVEVWAWV